MFPATANFQQARIVGFEALVPRDVQIVDRIGHQIDRRTDGDVRFHRRIERQQGVLGRFFQSRVVVTNAAVEDRSAVFGFTDLQEGRFLGRFERIALRIN